MNIPTYNGDDICSVACENQNEPAMKYLSAKTYTNVEIDVATATPDQLLDAYNSLFSMSDDGGAFPGSKAWAKAKVFADQLRDLTAARPEVVEYRKQIAAAAREARLVGVDVGGM